MLHLPISSFLRHVIKFIFPILLLTSYESTAQWKQMSNGLYGNWITSLINVNGNLFVGSFGGVFMSNDNGSTWKPMNIGLESLSVNYLAASGNFLFASVAGIGIYHSNDNGLSWNKLDLDAGGSRLEFIGDKLYCFNSNTNIFYSLTVGNSKASSNPLSLSAFVFDFTTLGKQLLLATDQGLYSSSDDGQTWNLNNELVSLTSSTTRIITVQTLDDIIMAWTSDGTFLSKDKGLTWEKTNFEGGYFSLSRQQDKLVAGTIDYAYISSNGGITWEKIPGLPAMTCYASNTSSQYSGTRYGVYRSIDEGASWTPANIGMMNFRVQAITISNKNAFVTNGNQLFVSNDQGASWADLHAGVPYNKYLLSLIASGPNLIAGTWSDGIYISGDNGLTWSLSTTLSGAIVFANMGNDLYAGNNSGVYVSHDHGASWNFFNAFSNASAMSALGNSLFVANFNGVVRFTNGQSTSILNGLPTGGEVVGFAKSNDHIFCATGAGVYSSIDNGDTWTTANNGIEKSLSVSAFIAYNDNLVAAMRVDGPFSADSKATLWSPLNDGLPVGVYNILNEITTFALIDNTLLMGTGIAGIWSMDGNLVTGDLTDSEAEEGLIYPNPAIQELVIDISRSSKEESVSILIYDLMGKLLQRTSENGSKRIALDVSHYSSGSYLVHVIYSDKNFYSRFVKQ
jgi:photosystem II stability/assembly factor-like uncharacterized protein